MHRYQYLMAVSLEAEPVLNGVCDSLQFFIIVISLRMIKLHRV
jgi:hypothetical protein